MGKTSIAIVGGGAAALILASELDSKRYNIAIYEKNAALGRKFLVAGKGGFNLTHAEPERQFTDRYTPAAFITPFLRAFSNDDFRNWLRKAGIDTYVGTSQRVFPVKGIKPVEVLKAIEEGIRRNGVELHLGHTWKGWSGKHVLFEVRGVATTVKADIIVFALGGGSWNVTGSAGDWLSLFAAQGVAVHEFLPSNCAYHISWDAEFIRQYAGSPLKNAVFTCGQSSRKGEAVLTEFGVEGSGIYPLSPSIRQQLKEHGEAMLQIDLKPDLDELEIARRLKEKGRLSVKDVLEKKLNLLPVHIALLKCSTTKAVYQDPSLLAKAVKSLHLRIQGFGPLDEAISTVGGIALEELNENQELKKMPGCYVIGEMSDWDAPTGGYLLQACFSMGYALAKHLNGLQARGSTFPNP